MEENIQTTATSRDFARDLQSMLQEAEALVRNAGKQLRGDYIAARDRVSSTVSASINDAKQSLTSQDSLVGRARDAARTTDSFVHGHPWQAVAAVAVIGFLIGIAASKR